MDGEIVVLGAAESGVGAAILAHKHGVSVFVSDNGEIASRYKAELDHWGIEYEEKGHSVERILRASEVIKSPGIPDTAPLIVSLLQKNIPIISEIEYAGRFTSSTLIGITGSNGKTTTTCWIHHLLCKAGLDASLAGNVGFSLARQVALQPHDYYVVELSSFQLDHMYAFRNHVSVLLNITPDHLDRYNYSFDQYAEAKMRILQNQTEDDYFIYWADDPFITQWLKRHPQSCRLLPFGFSDSDTYVFLHGDQLTLRDSDNWSISVDRLALSGKHNLQNAMAVMAVASALCIDKVVAREALEDYKNVPHRLEEVGVIDGVRYINDSKATNVNSTWYALESMRTPVVLLIGGTDKGNDYNEIMPLVEEKVRGMVFLTTDTTKLHTSFDHVVPSVVEAASMEEAVMAARKMAKEGDTVLLSPACASFDLFKNYEDRGDQFRTIVQRLIAKSEP